MRMIPGGVMVFAAGFGTRLGALTQTRPKPLIDVGRLTLLDHALAQAHAIEAPIVVNTHYLADQISAHLTGADVRISHETPDILDTGGGLKAARALMLEDPIVTLNSDVVWQGPNPLTTLIDAWDPARMEAVLLTMPVSRAEGVDGPGDFSRDADGRLTRRGPELYLGAQLMKTDRLNGIDDNAFSLNRVWEEMMASGGLFGATYPGRWCDSGNPAGLTAARALLAGSK